MLTIRKRGKYFHCRGSVRVGKEARIVTEHSTGQISKEAADAYRSKLEADLRTELLYGRGGRTHSLTIADAGLRYIDRPGGVRPYDEWRVDRINNLVGARPISQAADAWIDVKRKFGAGRSPATVQRYRSTFLAMINYLGREEGFDLPKLPRGDRVKPKPIRYLNDQQADRLVGCYTAHVQPIAVTLRWQGLRIGEALRLDWPNINWRAKSIFIADSKTGEARTVTMHKRTRAALHKLWASRGSPREGRVFLAPLLLPRSEGDTDWIDWAGVNWSDRTIALETETGERRSVRLAPRTFDALFRLWQASGSPTKGKVERRNLGTPYANPRQYKFPSGSPIKTAHLGACRRAGIADFTVHDWRHHWACQCVMAGIDLETIRLEGGWKSLRMVERYATVSAEHRAQAMAKLR